MTKTLRWAALAVLLAMPAGAQSLLPDVTGPSVPPVQDQVNQMRRLINQNFMLRNGGNQPVVPDALNALTANRYAWTFYAPFYPDPATGALCDWSATGEVGKCINAARAAALVVGAGEVILPAGTFGQTVTAAQTDNKVGVMVRGAGGVGNYGICGTTLKWIGAAGGTMVQFGSDTYANNVVGGGVDGICLDGNSLAATDLMMRSADNLTVRNLFATGATGVHVDIGTSATAGIGSSESIFDHLIIVAAGTAKGMVWSGNGVGNTHHNIFIAPHIQHVNGIGLECDDADTNTVTAYWGQPLGGGTGKSLVLNGSTSAGHACRSNAFLDNSEPQGGTTADDSTFPSANNTMRLNTESGAPFPVINGRATIDCRTQTGQNCGNQGTANLLQITPTDPAALPGDATRHMAGLASATYCSGTCTFTPHTSGVVKVGITGAWQTSAVPGNTNSFITLGTGTAPAANAAFVGAFTGGFLEWSPTTAAKNATFYAAGKFTGLTLGTAYWIDLGIQSDFAEGNLSLGGLTILIEEVP